MKSLNSGNLSKAIFMNINEGEFLMSCVGYDKYTPRFAEYVLPLDKREEQWQRIRDVKSDQRGCFIFSSKKDSQEWIKSVEKNSKVK